MTSHPAHLLTGTVEHTVSETILETLRRVGKDSLDWYFRDAFLNEEIGLGPFDVAIARFLKQRHRQDRILDLGAGMGQLSALLAANDFRVSAIEYYAPRFEVACLVRDSVSQKFLCARYDVLQVNFPTKRTSEIARGAVVAASNISYCLPDDEFESIIAALDPAEALLISVRNFFLPKSLEALRGQWAYEPVLLEILAKRGWRNLETIYEARDYEYKFQPDKLVYLRKAT